jgi:hypothetical protein
LPTTLEQKVKIKMIKTLVATLMGMAVFALSLPSRAVPLVVNHQPRAVIMLPENASPKLKDAAQVLQKYLQQSTGALLPIADKAGDGVAIHLGRSDYVDQQKLGIKNSMAMVLCSKELTPKTMSSPGRPIGARSSVFTSF